MEPVGMTKACTRVVVPNSKRMMVTVHFGNEALGLSGCGFGPDESGSCMGASWGALVGDDSLLRVHCSTL